MNGRMDEQCYRYDIFHPIFVRLLLTHAFTCASRKIKGAFGTLALKFMPPGSGLAGVRASPVVSPGRPTGPLFSFGWTKIA
jgi:hypothetical protein